uniref:SWIRM domain-containing protein n=1 Tax=Haemonchus contortus TaxID=6289 RepID=A0A7I4YH21_HAECO|nr:unnamed protein product [Haemonchus contortus]
MCDSFIADEVRRLELEEQLQSFHNSFKSYKQEENDGSIHSNLDGELDLDLLQHMKKRREYPAGRFLKKELEYIAETYCNNYETFYHSTVNGGKDKDAIARKKALLTEMAEHISTLGEEHRTPEQVEQKIRDELKRVKKYMAAKSQAGLSNNRREIILSSPQRMIAEVIEKTTVEPIKPKSSEQNGVEEAVAVDTSYIDVPTASSSMEVSPPLFNRQITSPLHVRRKKRRLLSQRELPSIQPDDCRNDFELLKEKRRILDEDMKYARAKLEAVTAERDYWMAKIDVLDLERQFWMREIERTLNGRL